VRDYGYLGERRRPITWEPQAVRPGPTIPPGLRSSTRRWVRPSVVKSAAKVDTLVERLTERRCPSAGSASATPAGPRTAVPPSSTRILTRLPQADHGDSQRQHENFAELRKDLQTRAMCSSPRRNRGGSALIEEFDTGNSVAAVREALAKLRGAYAM